jgi:protein-L-isoaspartate(D-aspartate) O-methyltransferase
MRPDHRPATLVAALYKQGIRDVRVLAAIEKTPRELFVDEPLAHAAYDNTALPIACGQTISQPYVVAYMTEQLEVGPNMRVLEIGTGSGYQAAVLAPLCRRVYTVERHKPLLKLAEGRFKQLKLENVVTRYGDGFEGWPLQAPFDRILLACAVEEVPATLIEQLKPGGILIAPVGQRENNSKESFSQLLTKMIRTETGIERQSLLPVVFVPMISGVAEAARPSDGLERNS